ncbi:cobyrinate a,c-diamide synthase [Desulforhopalus singaporensis]|uniref:Cobyrinate a,c-diamide synthase n=1 Tax=Desulforhopalus singaporensis TaxID=91360 RepID=A0A1H0NXX3_9BACT|nr:cobyrinate a,c-diamide synthase [Desulforhopalus singaporensis]SDO97240.1 hydrogenobyrinic acid a,c-diamide synthase (glutamine-hydrolysing) [Desulforhopalus singaporensis]
MTIHNTPAFVISGTSSGSGKTTVSLGLMAAFKARGFDVQPFKCGPDFIDPGLHTLITGNVSRNLDLWMAGENFTEYSFYQNASSGDIAIVEGVMGMFDGNRSSSGSLSAFLQLPNILVLDVRSMAESAAAIVKGFETFHPQAAVAGVILNRIASPRHLELVSDAIHKHCKAEIIGYLPRTLEFSIPSRHLGLHTGDEAPISQDGIELLAESVEQHIDLDRILELSRPAHGRRLDPENATPPSPRCRIGVARDKAFCFYYEDNFDILRNAGAELVFFSPLTDSSLPENIDGLYLGGGYPELYAEQLSGNTGMLASLRNWIENDRPVYAECGGFMYLTKGIMDKEGRFHPLVGAYPVRARMQTRRASLGYREITTIKPSIFGPEKTVLRGHEFHYSTIEEMTPDVASIYRVNNDTQEGYQYRRVLGGYMHLHFGYSPDVASAFINYCLEK